MEWLVAAAAAADVDAGDQLLAKRQMSRLTADFYIDLTGATIAAIWIGNTLSDEHAPQTAKQNALTIAGRLGSAGLLSGRTLIGADLRGLDLTNADLSDAALISANLSGMRLANTDLSRAGLRYANLTGVRMTGGSLCGADLTGSRWDRAAVLGTDGVDDAALAPELRAVAIANRDPAELVIRPPFAPADVVFSPDGSLLAVCTSNVVEVIDAGEGNVLRTLRGHSRQVFAAAFSPDGTLIATASGDRTARTWDTTTGTHRTTLTGHNGDVTAIAFSPDGALIATASGDRTARTWDTTTGTHRTTLVALPDGGYATLLPDGRYKLDGDPTDRVWWAIKLCRFEAGELDPYVPEIKRLPPDAAILSS